MGAPNSVSIKIEGRTLVNTGTEVLVISNRVYKAFQPGPELQGKGINLQTANGYPLQADSLSWVHIQIGNQSTPHDFFIVRNLNRNVILGHAKQGEDVF